MVSMVRLALAMLLAAVAFLVQHGFNALRLVLNNTFEQRVIFDLRSDLLPQGNGAFLVDPDVHGQFLRFIEV